MTVQLTQAPVDRCPACGARNEPSARSCALCSAPLAGPAASPAPAQEDRFRPPPLSGPAPAPRAALAPHLVLLAGLVLAPVFALTPILQYMAWFLASLVHEVGHCVVAWFTGHPAVPAIRLDGHAAAVHRPQSLALVAAVAIVLGWAFWMVRARPVARVLVGALVVLLPILAFTDAFHTVHLLGGHLGELAFGAVFLVRAVEGGFTESPAERITSACVGFMLVGRNVLHTFGLMTDAAARATYAGNGSFGLTNDYIRVARDHWHTSLEQVALVMFVMACLTPFVAAGVIWLRADRGSRALS